MLCDTKTTLKEKRRMNLQSKASWNMNKASEMLKFMIYLKGLGRF